MLYVWFAAWIIMLAWLIGILLKGDDGMKITLLECRRMIGRTVLLGFLALVLVVSVYDSHRNLDRYNLDEQGIIWKDNLSEARKASEGLCLDRECMEGLWEDANRYGYVNGENIMELVTANYGKTLVLPTVDTLSSQTSNLEWLNPAW